MSREFIYEDNDLVESPVDRLTIARAINKAHRRYAYTADVEGALLWVALSLWTVKSSAKTLSWIETLQALKRGGRGVGRMTPGHQMEREDDMNSAGEIEDISKEMIKAGTGALHRGDPRFQSNEELVCEIFAAMALASRKSRKPQGE